MKRRPNILWICTDQQRYDTVHALGYPHIVTPNLDQLCAQGVALLNTYCQSPICTPSRASFMTGLYPSTVHANINGNAHFNLPEGVKLITRRLADAGYDCGLSGKLHLASAWNGVEERVDDGYRRFWYSHGPCTGIGQGNQYIDWLKLNGRFEECIDDSNYDSKLRFGARYRENVAPELHQTTWCCDRAIEFFQESRNQPWLMSVNIFDPHPPYDAPSAYVERYNPALLPEPLFRESDLALQERLSTHFFQTSALRPEDAIKQRMANYYGMIELIDWNVGRMLEALEATGQRENTVVIFHSDHGHLLGDHGLEHKGCRFYEGLVKVPLIVSWPGIFQSGLQSDALVELTDLAPTLSDIAELNKGWTHGRSLVPLLRDNSRFESTRENVRCEYYDVVDINFGKPRQGVHQSSFATMYREGAYKLCVYHGSSYGELYNIDLDPHEYDNLWDTPGAQQIKNDLLKKSFDGCIVISDPGSQRIGRF